MTLRAVRLYYLALGLVMAFAVVMAESAQAQSYQKGSRPFIKTTKNKKVGRGMVVPGWYFGFSGGMGFVSDGSFEETGGAGRNGDLSYDEGYGFTGSVGYRFSGRNLFSDSIRVELEGGLWVNKVESFAQSTGVMNTLDDEVTMQTTMMNVLFDFNAGSGFKPYVGAGIGAGRMTLDSSFFNVDDTDAVFAYQGMLGITYQPWGMKNTEFGLGYRYLGTSDPQFTDTSGTVIDTEYSAHLIELNTRFRF
ncbi:MAG: outer membrane beta-barrel protein [Rickettsiales bacterium]|nr:outer membrane beta-barrel protein [Rickettsiales bacterium]